MRTTYYMSSSDKILIDFHWPLFLNPLINDLSLIPSISHVLNTSLSNYLPCTVYIIFKCLFRFLSQRDVTKHSALGAKGKRPVVEF